MLICNCRIARKKYIERVGKLQNVCVCVCVCMYIYIYMYAFIPECLNSIPSSSFSRYQMTPVDLIGFS